MISSIFHKERDFKIYLGFDVIFEKRFETYDYNDDAATVTPQQKQTRKLRVSRPSDFSGTLSASE